MSTPIQPENIQFPEEPGLEDIDRQMAAMPEGETKERMRTLLKQMYTIEEEKRGILQGLHDLFPEQYDRLVHELHSEGKIS